jgi:hypothetical protein
MYPIRFLIERAKRENYIRDIFCYAYNIHENEKYLKISIDKLTTYREKYLLLFFLTKKAFLEIDPVDIALYSFNEYDIEIIIIASKLCDIIINFNSTKNIVFDVLKEYFDEVTIDFESYSEKIAEIIFNGYQKHKEKFSFHKEFEKLKNSYFNSL